MLTLLQFWSFPSLLVPLKETPPLFFTTNKNVPCRKQLARNGYVNFLYQTVSVKNFSLPKNMCQEIQWKLFVKNSSLPKTFGKNYYVNVLCRKPLAKNHYLNFLCRKSFVKNYYINVLYRKPLVKNHYVNVLYRNFLAITNYPLFYYP